MIESGSLPGNAEPALKAVYVCMLAQSNCCVRVLSISGLLIVLGSWKSRLIMACHRHRVCLRFLLVDTCKVPITSMIIARTGKSQIINFYAAGRTPASDKMDFSIPSKQICRRFGLGGGVLTGDLVIGRCL